MYKIIELTISFLFTIISYKYLKNEYEKKSSFSVASLYVYTTTMFLVLGTYVMLEDMMSTKHSLLNVLKIITLISMLFVVAWTDFKERKIPNEVLLLCASIRLVYLLFELMLDTQLCLKTIKSILLLFGFTAIIFLIITLLTKNAIAVGDIKLILTLCLYLSYVDLVNAVFYSLLVSCVISVYFVVTKRKDLKDTIPLAPSFLIGLSLYFIINVNIL